MNKKTYHEPTTRIFALRHMHLLSGSGFGAGAQSDPGVKKSVSAAPSWDFEEEEEDYQQTTPSMTESTSASGCRPSKKAVGVFTLAAFLSYYTTGVRFVYSVALRVTLT